MQAIGVAGMEHITLSIARALNPESFYVSLVIPSEGSLALACRDAGVPYLLCPRPPLYSVSIRVGLRHFFNPLAALFNVLCMAWHARRLSNLLRKEKFDVVITKGMLANFYGTLAASKAGIACAWSSEDVVHAKRLFGLFPGILSFWARRFRVHVIAVSHAIANQFASDLRGSGRISVQHNGIDPESFHPDADGSSLRKEWGIGQNELLIGHCGRFAYWKGQLEFVEAAGLIAKERPDVKFVLVGSASMGDPFYVRRVRERIVALRLGRRCILAGFRVDMPRVLAALDVYVHASIKAEGLPMMVLQALSSGTPTVATRVSGTDEVITDNRFGQLVPPKDASAIAHAVKDLLSNPTRMRELAINGRSRVTNDFHIASQVSTWESLLRRIAGRDGDVTTT